MKRGHLYEYLERSGITEGSAHVELKEALERLTYCLGTKNQHAQVARTIEELLSQRYKQ